MAMRNDPVVDVAAPPARPPHIHIPTAEESPTIDLMVAADILGVSHSAAYDTAARNGELCEGVPVLRVGGRIKVPTVPFRRALGLDDYTPPPASRGRVRRRRAPRPAA